MTKPLNSRTLAPKTGETEQKVPQTHSKKPSVAGKQAPNGHNREPGTVRAVAKAKTVKAKAAEQTTIETAVNGVPLIGEMPATAEERLDAWCVLLNTLANTGYLGAALKASGLGRLQVLQKRESDKAFQELFDEAYECGYTLHEEKAMQRAFEGVEEPVFYKGDIVGNVTRYSDSLAAFLLKGNLPRKYREKSENVNINVDVDPNEEKDVEEALRAKLLG